MVEIVVFNILIPCTENATGLGHPPAKFDAWVLETADRFGGVTVVGLALQGLNREAALAYRDGRTRDVTQFPRAAAKRARRAGSSARGTLRRNRRPVTTVPAVSRTSRVG